MALSDSPHRSVRVLVVDNAQAITGGLNAIRNATDPLRDQQQMYFEYVLPSGSKGRAVLEAAGYTVHELPFIEISRRKREMLRYLPMLLLNGWRLRKLAKRMQADLVHMNDFYNLAGYVAKIYSLGNLKLITHVRFLPQSFPQPLTRAWRWLAGVGTNQLVCVSQAVRCYFGSAANVQVIYDPLPGSEKYAIPTHPTQADGLVHFLYLSNYILGKGQDFALESFRLAYVQNKNLRLRFAGGDMGMPKNQEFRQRLATAAAKAGLQHVVSFEGFVTDVEAEVKAADVILNFSESESFSLTCLDALYYGTALIASDCGGPAELFENNRSGLLVPNRNVQAMAAAIEQLAASSKLRTRFVEAGRQYVRHKFAPRHTYQTLGQLYQQVRVAS